MTHEVRITVDASFYKRPGDLGIACSKEEYEREIADRVSNMIGATHKFVNVKVDIVPHDNDRDYTEEDARRHCGRTYLDAVREAFPGADLHTIERSVCPGRLFPNHPSGVKSGFLCPKGSKPNCRECWREEIPDGEEARDHDD